MPALLPLTQLLHINHKKLSHEEHIFLEAELFIRLCKELIELFRLQHKHFFKLFNFSLEQENHMLEVNFIRLVIENILATQQYTPEGIAFYTDAPLEAIVDIIIGNNKDPSAKILRKLIELHREVRPDIYRAIIDKITKS